MFLGITPISQHQVSEAQLERPRSCGMMGMIGRDDTMMTLETRHALRLWGGNAGLLAKILMVGFILSWTALTLLAAMQRRSIVRSQGPRHLDMPAP